MKIPHLLLATLLMSLALASCGVRGDPKPLDPATDESAQ